MISNVAMQTTDTASAAPAAMEAGDTGAFEALLALQSLQTQASAEAAVPVDVLAGLIEEPVEDATDDDAEFADDALSFLAALLPAAKLTVATPSGSTAFVPSSNGPPSDANAALPASTLAAAAPDLAESFKSDVSVGQDLELPVLTSMTTAALVDTAQWSSMSGPAELFAQGARPAERVESAPLTTHVRDPRWVDDLGHRLASMVRTGDSSASLQLTPLDLGPLEVNVAVRDNQATVHFGAANAETRALLEASLPRLREMLEAQGFQLMDSSVSHGFAKSARHESAGTPRVDDEAAPAQAVQAVHITGLLDLYA
jgi:flagellar hook-length control protein FliK